MPATGKKAFGVEFTVCVRDPGEGIVVAGTRVKEPECVQVISNPDVCVGDHLSEEGQEIETEEKNTMYTM
jgi:hypothetical protein